MVSTRRTWTEEQLRAAELYLSTFAVPGARLAPTGTPGVTAGEHAGVRFLRYEHDGSVEVLPEETTDAALTRLLESYNAWAAGHFET
jgi:hypothetical protein